MRRKSQPARSLRRADDPAPGSPWDPHSTRSETEVADARAGDPPDPDASPGWVSRLVPSAGAGPTAWALLPMRVFFGAMFLYAGLDKLVDPTFLRAEGIGSIGEQLHGFVDISPLAPLITTFALPFPVLVGFGIAVLEIAIGLGALLGLLYRAAAVAGMALSLLFFLTASWDTHPYYLGADLPYAVGWLTLALAGDGGLLTVDAWLRRRDAERTTLARSPYPARRSGRQAGWQRSAGPVPRQPVLSEAEVTTRRRFLELGILAMASIGVAAFAVTSPFRGRLDEIIAGGGGAGGASPSPNGGGVAVATPTPAASAAPGAPGAAGSPVASAPAGATLVGQLAQVPAGQAATFAIPTTGDPGILVHLDSGEAVAYDALCTHEGCEVEFDTGQALLFCPCHGAVFDPANGARVLRGPARRPLPELTVQIDDAGNVYVKA